MIKSIISLVRPQQWIKNIFVLLPLFFGGQLFNAWAFQQAIITFFAFSFIASSIYCLNDLKDIEADRHHPKKCKRPLAAGKLKPAHAVTLMVILIAASLLISTLLLGEQSLNVSIVLLIYLLLNIGYCLKLKHYAIVDVFIVSFGFVLRIVAGGLACSIWLSPWIVLMTFLLALFLAFAKRRDDVALYEKSNIIARRNIVRYNLPFLNQTLSIVGTITIVCYIMYSVSPEVVVRFHSNYVYITSILVLAAILRYLQLALVDSKTGSPTKVLLHDHFIQAAILLWIIAFSVILYL